MAFTPPVNSFWQSVIHESYKKKDILYAVTNSLHNHTRCKKNFTQCSNKKTDKIR